ncbi:MAG TPA: c-type cytochrome [Acidobacteriota bacterium]|nr:c-type cytochrome [Acidobacteriota bacterium]HQG92646.1 c-type cytochrome [Acidobacteriota bacterium]
MHQTCFRMTRPAPLTFGLAALLLILSVGVAAAGGPAARTGEQLYLAACAHCHGVDGRGVPAEQLALPVPIRDFTDCRFAPREPDSDWFAVMHEGGPARAFHRTMPAFGDALTSEELQLALTHVRTFCAEKSWPRGELNFPKALITEKAFPEDELLVVSSVALEGDGAVSNKVIYEKRFGARNQIELVVPFAARDRADGSWQGGLGDMAFAYKRVLAANWRTGTIVSLTGELVFPTGSETRGFGSGCFTVEPFVTFGQALPADSFVQFQGGFGIPIDDEADNEAFWRTALGKTFTQGISGRSWTPMVEILGSRELADGKSTDWDVVPQLQVSLSQRQHILFNVGVRLPVTDTGPRRTQLVMYLLWDWFDGGFLEGW